MATALGLVALVLFIAAVIVLAAAITWVVVKVTPQRRQKSEQAS
jgi:FlaG/FlaF family flagellin (archaellin)